MERISRIDIECTKESFIYEAKYTIDLRYGRFVEGYTLPTVELWPLTQVTRGVVGEDPVFWILNSHTSGGTRLPFSSLKGNFYRLEENSATQVAIEGELLVRDNIQKYLNRVNSSIISFPEKLEKDWGIGQGQEKMFGINVVRLDLDYFVLISYCTQPWIGPDSLQEIIRCLEDDYNTEGLSFSVRMVQIGKAETGLSNWAFRVYFDLKES